MLDDFKVQRAGGVSFCKDLLLLSENGKSLFEETQLSPALSAVRKSFSELIDFVKAKVGAKAPNA